MGFCVNTERYMQHVFPTASRSHLQNISPKICISYACIYPRVCLHVFEMQAINSSHVHNVLQTRGKEKYFSTTSLVCIHSRVLSSKQIVPTKSISLQISCTHVISFSYSISCTCNIHT